MIRLEKITKDFIGPNGKVTALRNVSLSLKPGELLAINGPSGCGKSTLLLIAAGMLRPDQGDVQWVGNDHPYDLPSEQRSRLRAGLVGFVFQQFHLIPYLSVGENIQVPSLASSAADPETRARELIQHFGLQERADHIPSQLSTGEKQRAALARAFFNQPKIILADEPTGNLDDENAEIVLQHLRQFVLNGGSVLLVTHNAKAADYATRIVKMKAGQLLS
jgi:ABC-type lipoprotein export system ATPase subunit